jgi:hypothetical protein
MKNIEKERKNPCFVAFWKYNNKLQGQFEISNKDGRRFYLINTCTV